MPSTPVEFLGDRDLLTIVQNRSDGWEDACRQLGGYIEHAQDDFGTPNCNLPAALGGFTYVPPSRDPFADAVATGIAVFGGPVGKAAVAVSELPAFRNPVSAPVRPSAQAIAAARAKNARIRARRPPLKLSRRPLRTTGRYSAVRPPTGLNFRALQGIFRGE